MIVKKLLLFIFFSLSIGCTDNETLVEITDDVARTKYIELLEQKKISYYLDEKSVIHVNVSNDELEISMKEYDEWRKKMLKEQGVKFIEKE